MIINGKITNLEEDMIEVLTYPEKDTIYIDFGYCGIPKNLNIEKIREIDPIKLDIDNKSHDNPDIEQQDQYKTESDDSGFFKQYDVDQNIVISLNDDNDEFNNYKSQDLFVDLETIKIGEDLEDFHHTVNVMMMK